MEKHANQLSEASEKASKRGTDDEEEKKTEEARSEYTDRQSEMVTKRPLALNVASRTSDVT